MPGFHIHLAIGNRYIEKHYVENKEEFLKGSVAPDFEQKSKSHYTIEVPPENLVKHLENKVSIEHFLKENEVKTDYQKGVFLHLLTDKIFFTEFFEREYLNKSTNESFRRDLYYSYRKTNSYIEEKYKLNLQGELFKKINDNIKKANLKNKVDENSNYILPLDKLENFIEKMSDTLIEDFLDENYNLLI